MLVIQHATIYTPDRVITDGTLIIEKGHIKSVMGPDEPEMPAAAAHIINANGQHLVPGFIDLQLNGACDHDFTSNPASIWSVAAKLPRYGVTSFLPTIITSPLSTIQQAQANIHHLPFAIHHSPFSTPLGLHLEGPFLNLQKKGAHNPIYLQLPDLNSITDWTAEKGVRLVTLAPELSGALPVIRRLTAQGVVVSAGHSLATLAEMEAGVNAGIRYATHLCNAMPPLHHRHPGLVGAVLADEQMIAGIIPDGIHVHPEIIKVVWRAKGAHRLTLVTDAMAALGMPPGQYPIGSHTVNVSETEARLPDGTLAGSILSLDQALRNLIRFTGCTLAEALPTITATPAKLLGLSHKIGHITPGLQADLVLLNENYQVKLTIIKGNVAVNNK